MNKKITYIVAGLGNPGKKYENTRHNMGYLALDELFDMWQLSKYRKRFSSLCSVTKEHGAKIILLKPLTFMNDSGRAIKKAASFYKVIPENIIVIYDDIDLPEGALRIRKHGGPGTHNGMRSIVSHIGEKFPRVRIGIGKDRDDLINYVLSAPSKASRKILAGTLSEAAKAIDMIISNGVEKSMQQYNKK